MHISYDRKSGLWVARSTNDLVVSQGSSPAEARANIEHAIELFCEMRPDRADEFERTEALES